MNSVIKQKLQNLLTAANTATGESDTDLTDAVQTLVDGYGQGGATITDGIIFENLNSNYQPTKLKVYGERIGDRILSNGVINTSTPLACFVQEVDFVNAKTIGAAVMKTAKSGGDALTIQKVSAFEAKTVGNGAFFGCAAMTEINLPLLEDLFLPYDAIVSHTDSNYAGAEFGSCSALETISLPKCKNINRLTFGSCRSLKTVYLPCCTYTIARNNNNGSFYACTALENVQIGSVGHGITYLNAYTFYDCTQSGLTIVLYTTGSYVDTAVANARNGATNATIIIKASEATTYGGNSYAAGDTILTSTP